MANQQKYTPEVEKLLLAARGLYEAAQRAKLTPGLAIALRDGIAFEKLQDPELFSLCSFVKELDKAAKLATEAKPDAPTAEAGNGNAAAAGEINGKPDDKKGKGSKGGKGADAAT